MVNWSTSYFFQTKQYTGQYKTLTTYTLYTISMSNQDGDTGSGHNLSTKTIYLGTWHGILCQEPVGGVRNGNQHWNEFFECTQCK